MYNENILLASLRQARAYILVKWNKESKSIWEKSVSCSSKKSPYKAKNTYNCTTLKKCHHTLAASLPCKLGEKPSRRIKTKITGSPFLAGHCAEPHAAQKLLNSMSNAAINMKIKDIDFSDALMVKNNLLKDYCRTCKLTFPQLQ